MVHFDAAVVKGDVDRTMTQLGQRIESICQQLSDCTVQVRGLIGENQTLQGLLTAKEGEIVRLETLVGEHSVASQKLDAKVTELQNDNDALRRKNKNQGADINSLREQRELCQDIIEDVQTGLELLAALAEEASVEAEEADLAVSSLQEEIADSERGRYKGVFICCGNEQHLSQNQDNFLRLIDALPQIDWGRDPLYVLKDQQRPGIPEGMHLVAILYRGLSHSDVTALKKSAKLTGANVIMHSNPAQMVALVRQWLQNPDFSQVGVPYPIRDMS